MTIGAGARPHHLLLFAVGAPTADGDGGYTETPIPLTPPEVWAKIEPATVRNLERIVAGTVVAAASHVVTMPYHAGVTSKTRMLFGSRTLIVVGVVDPEERHLETIALCTELLP